MDARPVQKVKCGMARALCNTCGTDTIHRVLHREELRVPASDPQYEFNDRWELLQCSGCETVSVRRTCWELPDAAWEHFFPVRTVRKRPSWLGNLTRMQVRTGEIFPSQVLDDIDALVQQTYNAQDHELYALAAMGVRAILDTAMTKVIGDVGTFKQKLDAFETGGFIGRKDREALEGVIEAGNAASHRGFAPSPKDLNTLMEIMEQVIGNLFVRPNQLSDMQRRVPPRKR